MPVEIKDGLLRLPNGAHIPPKSRLAIIVLDENESDPEFHRLADVGGAFNFLSEEPDIYSDADVLPNRKNTRFPGTH